MEMQYQPQEELIMIIDERIFSKLTDEQKKAVEAARSPEELLAVAEETGYQLSDEQLKAVSGGSWCSDHCSALCPGFCGKDASCVDKCQYGSCDTLCLKV